MGRRPDEAGVSPPAVSREAVVFALRAWGESQQGADVLQELCGSLGVEGRGQPKLDLLQVVLDDSYEGLHPDQAKGTSALAVVGKPGRFSELYDKSRLPRSP